MKKLIYILLLLVSSNVFALKTRAGEITFTHISGLTYEFTATFYTKTSSPPLLLLCVNSSDTSVIDTLSLTNSTVLSNDITKSDYVWQRTFPGSSPNPYIISIDCSYRVSGINNIPNSVNTLFYIETELYINPFLGINNSPIFINPPVDSTCLNTLYNYNSGAVDADGDSLYYTLQQSLKEDGQPIANYQFPQTSNSFIIDNNTGEITWDAPFLIGLYNFDVLIEEFRNGFKIGSVLREIQIDVKPTCIVGIDETLDEKLNLKIYPNPFNNELTINYVPIAIGITNNQATLVIYNLVGKEILTKTILENITKIDLNAQPNGIYFITITDGNNRISQKIIKQ